MTHASPRHRAFTLIETLIVLAILAAVAALVLPGTVGQLRAARTDQITRDIVLAADSCRSQAIRTGQPWRLILTQRGITRSLAIEPLARADERSRSASETPADTPVLSATRQELIALPDACRIAASAVADQHDGPKTDAETSDPSGADSGSEPATDDAAPLAIFLPDGSVIARPFELTARETRIRFTPHAISGRFTFAPVEQATAGPDAPPEAP
jgi:prepilin-type N-terminal cleavage/methylation domain-containing protein